MKYDTSTLENRIKLIEILQNRQGFKFKANKNGYGELIEGKINIERGNVYLCQNVISGASCSDKLGYHKSYVFESYDDVSGWTNFEILNYRTKEELLNEMFK